MLPFNLRSAPKIFTAITDAIEWVLHCRSTQCVWHYIDEFVFCGPPASVACASTLDTALVTCGELGVPIMRHKVEGLGTDATILGIQVDTVAQTLSLPDDKLQRLQHLLTAWGDKRACTCRELESLVGLLNHTCKVVRPGCSFLRRMPNLLPRTGSTASPQPHHWIRLNHDFRADLQCWHTFVADWNGVAALPDPRPISVEMMSEASVAWGCGAYWHPHWFQIQWSTRARPLPIAVKELLPVVVHGSGHLGPFVGSEQSALSLRQSIGGAGYLVPHKSPSAHDALAQAPVLPQGQVPTRRGVHPHTRCFKRPGG